MIFDHTSYLHRYHLPYLDEVKAFLARPDLLKLTEPEIELRGRDLFVRLMRYIPKAAEHNKFETHRTYADIQVIVSGREIMQWAPSHVLKPTTEYDIKNDYQFFTVESDISSFSVDRNHFTVFFPGEAHRPSCLVAHGDSEVFKLVFKVRV